MIDYERPSKLEIVARRNVIAMKRRRDENWDRIRTIMEREIKFCIGNRELDALNSGESITVELGASTVTVQPIRSEARNPSDPLPIIHDLHGWDRDDCSMSYVGGGQWRFKVGYDNALSFSQRLREAANKIEAAYKMGPWTRVKWYAEPSAVEKIMRSMEHKPKPAPRSTEKIMQDAALAHEAAIRDLHAQMLRPSRLQPTKIFKDGDQWCCLLGEDIQSGVAGWGPTPAAAMLDFDNNWHKAD